MVTTRRSVFATPTIPVARALRRQRCARDAEAEILPHSQPQGKKTRRSKTTAAAAKATTKKKNQVAEPPPLTPNANVLPQVDLTPGSPILYSKETIQLSPPHQSQNPPPSTQPYGSSTAWPTADCNVQFNLTQEDSILSSAETTRPPSPNGSQNPPPSSQPAPRICVSPASTQQSHLPQSFPGQVSQESSDLLGPNGSQQNPPSSSQHQPAEAQKTPWFGMGTTGHLSPTSTPQLNFSQSFPGQVSQESSEHLSPSGSQQNPPNGSQQHQPAKAPETSWFSAPTTIRHVSLPHPAAPNFKPVDSLFNFATGVPPPEEKKPFGNGGPNGWGKGDFLDGCKDEESMAAFMARRHDAISKAATAVMAHMNGHRADRSDYLSILDTMLLDPEMRGQLPPALLARYQEAMNEEPSTLYNGGLIDKFINATKKATNVTARILLKNKIGKRERRTRGPRHRPPMRRPSACMRQSPVPSISEEQFDQQSIASSGNPCAASSARAQSLGGLGGGPLAPEPLTEANLNRAPDDLFKGKARDIAGLWDEDRGVMRTTKGSVRALPYPRRDSADSFRMAAALGDPSGNSRHMEVPDESSYSVYSASTGLLHQQNEATRVVNSMVEGVKRMQEPESYDAQCVRNAEIVLEETARQKGEPMAASVRRGFDLLHCYDVLKQVNVEMLSEALLEHMSPKQPPVNPQPSHNPVQTRTRMFDDIPQPPSEMCEHARFGPGVISFIKVFHPVGSKEHYAETIHTPRLT